MEFENAYLVIITTMRDIAFEIRYLNPSTEVRAKSIYQPPGPRHMELRHRAFVSEASEGAEIFAKEG